jgi:hypothetical protein
MQAQSVFSFGGSTIQTGHSLASPVKMYADYDDLKSMFNEGMNDPNLDTYKSSIIHAIDADEQSEASRVFTNLLNYCKDMNEKDVKFLIWKYMPKANTMNTKRFSELIFREYQFNTVPLLAAHTQIVDERLRQLYADKNFYVIGTRPSFGVLKVDLIL